MDRVKIEAHCREWFKKHAAAEAAEDGHSMGEALIRAAARGWGLTEAEAVAERGVPGVKPKVGTPAKRRPAR
jgi:hypothetical protein